MREAPIKRLGNPSNTKVIHSYRDQKSTNQAGIANVQYQAIQSMVYRNTHNEAYQRLKYALKRLIQRS